MPDTEQHKINTLIDPFFKYTKSSIYFLVLIGDTIMGMNSSLKAAQRFDLIHISK